jgi:hypothetical protein
VGQRRLQRRELQAPVEEVGPNGQHDQRRPGTGQRGGERHAFRRIDHRGEQLLELVHDQHQSTGPSGSRADATQLVGPCSQPLGKPAGLDPEDGRQPRGERSERMRPGGQNDLRPQRPPAGEGGDDAGP